MIDEDDPFADPFDEETDNETTDEEDVEEEDPPDDAEDQAPERPATKSKTKYDQPTPGRRDYGRTGIVTPDPADLEQLTQLLKTHIKKMGTYETLTCLANAFEQHGTDLNSDPKTTGRGSVFHDAATIVDDIVSKLSNGKR
jgi:hypothetical protein